MPPLQSSKHCALPSWSFAELDNLSFLIGFFQVDSPSSTFSMYSMRRIRWLIHQSCAGGSILRHQLKMPSVPSVPFRVSLCDIRELALEGQPVQSAI